MEPETLLGNSPNGSLRRLDCWVDGEGQLALWIHPPESDGGWEIRVSRTDFARALARLGVMLPGDATPG